MVLSSVAKSPFLQILLDLWAIFGDLTQCEHSFLNEGNDVP